MFNLSCLFPCALQRGFADEPLLVCVCRSGDDAPEVFSVDLQDGETERLSVAVVKENILSSYTVLRLRGALPLGFDFTTEKGKYLKCCLLSPFFHLGPLQGRGGKGPHHSVCSALSTSHLHLS